MYRTNIEWVLNPDGTPGFALNPFTGCINHTTEGLCLGGMFPCYAWKLAHGRLKAHYLANDNIAPLLRGAGQRVYRLATKRGIVPKDEVLADPFYPRFWDERLKELTKRNDMLWEYDSEKPRARPKNTKPIGIFLCDMADIFGVGIPTGWTEKVLDEVWGNKGYDRFYILTKQASRLPLFEPFPPNCWVGVTATNADMLFDAINLLDDIQCKTRYVSIEPMLASCHLEDLADYLDLGSTIKQVIIGACTGKKNEIMELCKRYPELTPMPYGKIWTAQPKLEWVEEIVRACDKAGIKVFLKDNLEPMLPRGNEMYRRRIGFENCEYKWRLRQEMP